MVRWEKWLLRNTKTFDVLLLSSLAGPTIPSSFAVSTFSCCRSPERQQSAALIIQSHQRVQTYDVEFDTISLLILLGGDVRTPNTTNTHAGLPSKKLPTCPSHSVSLFWCSKQTQRPCKRGCVTSNEAWDRKFWLPHHATHGNLRQSSSIIIIFFISPCDVAKTFSVTLRVIVSLHTHPNSPNMIVVLWLCGILPHLARGIVMTKSSRERRAHNGRRDDDVCDI